MRRLRRRVRRTWLVVLLLCGGVASGLQAAGARRPLPPSEIFGDLFTEVQLRQVFADSKTFPDAIPAADPDRILAEFQAQKNDARFDLRGFVAGHFSTPRELPQSMLAHTGWDVRVYIDRLWDVLTRMPAKPVPYSSRIELPYRYVVPGGRFSEIYYWDSYFTMLGLDASGRHDLTLAMLDNFAWLIDQYGFIPNGTRSYYLSRSQPPFFSLMVELVAARDGPAVYTKFATQLKREYAYWMNGQDTATVTLAQRHVVRMRDGSLLNRYWDERDAPRDEAYREDVETARASGRPARDVYRDLRAAAESGWDFSSRWFADGKSLASIHTTDLVPPDLNSLLHRLELTIARACEQAHDEPCTRDMQARANARKAAIGRYLWDAKLGAFTDYDWRTHRSTGKLTAATLYPLFLNVSTPEQARAVAKLVRAKLLEPRGLGTTTVVSGQQWDAPNGWAPLQWIAIRGLTAYGERSLAGLIARRWVHANLDYYRVTGKLVEKYDLRSKAGGRGGEYPLQDGFGWSNGVLRSLLALYPDLPHL